MAKPNGTNAQLTIKVREFTIDDDMLTVDLELRGSFNDGDNRVTVHPPQRQTVEIPLGGHGQPVVEELPRAARLDRRQKGAI